MAGFDVNCPKCGRLSAEFDESRRKCLHCGITFACKPETTGLEGEDGPIDLGMDFTDSGKTRKTGDSSDSETPIILATESEGLELLPDIGPGKSSDAGGLLGFEKDDEFRKPESHRTFDALPDDLQDEEGYYSDSIVDPDYPESDANTSSLSNRGRRYKRALILSTIGIVFVLWIASLFNRDTYQGDLRGKKLALVEKKSSAGEGGSVKPNPEPIKTRPEPQNGTEAALTPKQIFQKAKPSTVMVVVRDILGDETAFGSGFFIDSGTIVSNFHVVEGAYSGYVRSIGTQRRYEIQGFVAMDKKLDLVVLKVSSAPFPPLAIGNSDLVEVGDPIYVVGNPQGLEGTFSDGIVSNMTNVKGHNHLQITAPISRGNSGGPMLNSRGDIVGVVVASHKNGQNLNLAIPSNYIKPLLDHPGEALPFSSVRRR